MVVEQVILDIKTKADNNLKALQNDLKAIQKELTTTSRIMNQQNKNFAKNQSRLNSVMNGGAQRLIDHTTGIQRMANKFDSFGGVMRMSQESFKKFNKEGAEFTSKGGKMANSIRKSVLYIRASVLTHSVSYVRSFT